MTSCSRKEDSPVAPPGAEDARQAARVEVAHIGLSERTDPQLGDELAKVSSKTTPVLVDLTWSKVSGDVLEPLQGMENLQELRLYGTDVSDDELRYLSELPDLQHEYLG